MTLIDLDCVKRMLYTQISLNKALNYEKTQLDDRHKAMDEQINNTLNGYQTVLETTEKNSSDTQLKHQIKEQQALYARTKEDISKIGEDSYLQDDKALAIEESLKKSEKIIEEGREQLKKLNATLGVPKKDFELVEKQVEKTKNELEEISKQYKDQKAENERADKNTE